VPCCACAQARARVGAEASPSSVGESDGDGVGAIEGLAVAGARVSPTLVGAAAGNAPMDTRHKAAALQRNVEREGSTGRAPWAAQRLAIGITAAGDVRVEEDDAGVDIGIAVAPCRVAAFVAAANVG
jgi:hypothetical protein